MKRLFAGTTCAAALLLLTIPGRAESSGDPTVLHAAVGNLQQEDPYTQLSGAVAACLSGQGDANLTTGWFEENGWQRKEEPDMGIIEMTPPNTDKLYAWVADDGSACSVWSEEIGTDQAHKILNDLVDAAGVPFERMTGDLGCEGMTVSVDYVGYAVEVTSSGNDPVCKDDNTSGFHILRAEG